MSKPFPPARKIGESQEDFVDRFAKESAQAPTPEIELREAGSAFLADPDANRDAFADSALNAVLHDHLTAVQVAHISGVPVDDVTALVDEHRS